MTAAAQLLDAVVPIVRTPPATLRTAWTTSTSVFAVNVRLRRFSLRRRAKTRDRSASVEVATFGTTHFRRFSMNHEASTKPHGRGART